MLKAEELNTPLGAILSADRSMEKFETKIWDFLDFYQSTTQEEKKCFTALAMKSKNLMTGQESTDTRKRKKEIITLLQKKAIENPGLLVEKLVKTTFSAVRAR